MATKKISAEKLLRFIAIHVVLVLLAFKVGSFVYNYHQDWFYSDMARLTYLYESKLKTWDNPELSLERTQDHVKVGSVLFGMIAGLFIFFSLSLFTRYFFHWEHLEQDQNNPDDNS